MTDIDLATGLPELPDGHYWSLGKYGVSIRKRLPDTQWRKEIWSDWGFSMAYNLIQKETERSTQETKTQIEQVETRVQVHHWWSWKAKYKTVTKEGEVTYYRWVNCSEEVVNVPTDYTGETKTIYGTERYAGARHTSYGYYGGSYGTPVYERTPDKVVKLREALTRDNVLELCEKALKELDGLTLQGDYPPKKFDRD